MDTIFDYLAKELDNEYESEYDSTLKKNIQLPKSTSLTKKTKFVTILKWKSCSCISSFHLCQVIVLYL
ncbi:MAG: hypothetical protein CMC55_00015 [Flavobacteriaceae bacterium]|nr:hypothetical protein [Flavobacteriaceae bacterium]